MQRQAHSLSQKRMHVLSVTRKSIDCFTTKYICIFYCCDNETNLDREKSCHHGEKFQLPYYQSAAHHPPIKQAYDQFHLVATGRNSREKPFYTALCCPTKTTPMLQWSNTAKHKLWLCYTILIITEKNFETSHFWHQIVACRVSHIYPMCSQKENKACDN